MRPRVVIYNEISLDGRMDRLDVDMARFYRLAGTWKEDVTLVGSETILAAMPELASPAPASAADQERAAAGEPAEVPADGPADGDRSALEGAAGGSGPGEAAEEDDRKEAGGRSPDAPLLAGVDARGRVPGLAALRSQPYWREVVGLCSAATPAEYLETLARDGVESFVSGTEHVDLTAALGWLAERHGSRLVRVDAGGSLVGALLRAGLVDEVSVLIEPRLVGGETPRWLVHAPNAAEDEVAHLRLQYVERFDDDVVWLRYEVTRD